MKSNVCKIEKGTRDLGAILKESEKVAVYNELTPKQTLHLRLLCEEIDGMLPNILGDFEGNLWIDFEDGVCKINISITAPELDQAKREELIGVSKNKKNAAAVGIIGKIRNAVESFFLNVSIADSYITSSGTFCASTGFSEFVDYSCVWTLEEYRNQVKEKANAEDWDELEKSVIASAADDVIIGVKGRKVDIVIVKKFA